jgi:uncharacterized membrane protein YhiD involved in acid resistance
MTFEEILNQFNATVDLPFFILNLVVATILALSVRLFYIRFGQAVANRRKFASNFIPLAITTVLIITIIKSSIALSLGLVGALSIVRFRAAIKDPEELIYLFLIIGIGLATGANYPILATISIALILILLYVNALISKREVYQKENMLYVNVHSDHQNLDDFVKVLNDNMDYVELKRLDRSAQQLDATFICKAPKLDALTAVQEKMISISASTRVSIVDQPDLIV